MKVTNTALKEITIFDVDDTLIHTNGKIRITDTVTGEKFELTPLELHSFPEDYERYEYDCDDFNRIENLLEGELIDEYVSKMKALHAAGKAVGIITAREHIDMIWEFVKQKIGIELDINLIFAVWDAKAPFTGNTDERKYQAFEKLIELGYNKFEFYDDGMANINTANSIPDKYPNVIMNAHFVQ